MILIFGGAYQGKREFAKEQFPEVPIFDDALENFTWACCAEDPAMRSEAADWMRQCREEWQDKILIIRDISQGIVPMEAEQRAWREMNGRLMIYLAGEAEQVIRVFCGIGKRIDQGESTGR